MRPVRATRPVRAPRIRRAARPAIRPASTSWSWPTAPTQPKSSISTCQAPRRSTPCPRWCSRMAVCGSRVIAARSPTSASRSCSDRAALGPARASTIGSARISAAPAWPGPTLTASSCTTSPTPSCCCRTRPTRSAWIPRGCSSEATARVVTSRRRSTCAGPSSKARARATPVRLRWRRSGSRASTTSRPGTPTTSRIGTARSPVRPARPSAIRRAPCRPASIRDRAGPAGSSARRPSWR